MNPESRSSRDVSSGQCARLSAVAQLRQLQLQRLQFMVQRAYERVPLYRGRMDERKLTPSDIRSLGDIVRLPFTTKTDLRDTYPFGLFASPLKEIVRFHASSGTTGKPIVVAYTQEDVQDWTQAMMRSFLACGLHSGDVIQNAYGYGLFTGGLGAHYGAEALGAGVIPISGGNTERQIMILKDFGVTAICCTPSYFIHLIERARELGVDLKALPLAGRGVWGGTVDRGDAAADRGGDESEGVRHLRAVGDHRAGGGDGMSAPGRAAHLRGPVLSRR
jgi:phenylacetate-coenzyme A ligase PaaK-like adenylate-forming protein